MTWSLCKESQSLRQRVNHSRRRGQNTRCRGHRRGAAIGRNCARCERKRQTAHTVRSITKEERPMSLLKPDPTFYPSPKMAMQAPPERLAYVALINPTKQGPSDAIGVVDTDPESKGYGKLVEQVDMPHAGDELHHKHAARR